MNSEWDAALATYRVLPVLRVDHASDADGIASTLNAAKLPLAEITLRTESALGILQTLAGHPELIVGAGTVCNRAQAAAAVEAGARFIVSPGLDRETVHWCLDRGIPITPGIATPSELQRAWNWGLRTVKFFPAVPLGGVAMMKALRGPFPDVRFVPTGGILPQQLGEYLAFEGTLAVGGSWMLKRNKEGTIDVPASIETIRTALGIVRGEDSA